ncbi:MAG: chromate resistance protein [Burkholderiales bacterium]|nr:chromate resistance protein [Burkholderiales bacterium]
MRLPAEEPAGRMRVLRTLESLGCAMLREGVYLLPDTTDNRQSLEHLAGHVRRMNGNSHVLAIVSHDAAQAKEFRNLFDRSGRYEDLAKTIESLSAGFGISDPGAIARVLAKQRREFEAIGSLDFFTSPARERAERTLREAEQRVQALLFPNGPEADRPGQKRRDYFQRVWATRKPLWADRLASAWLIRRFIDPEAMLLWLDKPVQCPHTAVTFGFDGASFGNSRNQVTFEVLLAAFDLAGNPMLSRIGTLVHYLESGGDPVAEAAGVEVLLQGARRRSGSDDGLFAESEKTFDLLYEAYVDSPGKL